MKVVSRYVLYEVTRRRKGEGLGAALITISASTIIWVYIRASHGFLSSLLYEISVIQLLHLNQLILAFNYLQHSKSVITLIYVYPLPFPILPLPPPYDLYPSSSTSMGTSSMASLPVWLV